MTPLSFDPETAREVLGDEEARKVAEQGRLAAERGESLHPFTIPKGMSYWEGVLVAMRFVVWAEAHDKRTARMIRIKEAAEKGGTRRPVHTK